MICDAESKDSELNELERKRMVMKNDPVMQMNVYTILMKKMEEQAKFIGQENFQKLWNSVDREVMKQFQEYRNKVK